MAIINKSSSASESKSSYVNPDVGCDGVMATSGDQGNSTKFRAAAWDGQENFCWATSDGHGSGSRSQWSKVGGRTYAKNRKLK